MAIDFQSVLHWAKLNAPLSFSHIHGELHWIKVRENGIKLAEDTPGADAVLIELFGFLHDSQRENENKDPDHGKRAARHIIKIRNNLLKDLTDEQFEKLQYAISNHNSPMIEKDPTVGCCWDADRLDISRVGIPVQKSFLSTEAGKRRVR